MIKKQDNELLRRLHQYEHRAKVAEAEIVAVKSSKAYKIAKSMGAVKCGLKDDPVKFIGKVAKTTFTQPRKIIARYRNGQATNSGILEQTNKYQEWILLNEPSEDEFNVQRSASESFIYRPLISIITPVFNPPIKVLEDLIESVLEQTYPNFELCLGNFGNDQGVSSLIEKYAKIDNRIKNWTFAENKGIAGNSNAILNKASGEYIALLDHDDTLSPDALYENVKALNSKKYDFLYSDKDKIDEKGNRFDPLFKPEFSIDMLLNINYLTHFNIIKTELVRKVGGWNSETDGAQDWDLFLKVVSATKSICHISKILYHWRVISSSTALSIETKPYALAGQRCAIDGYLIEHNIPGKSFHNKTELFIKWNDAALSKRPIVIINSSTKMNTARIIRRFLRRVPGARFVVVGDTNDTIYNGQSAVGIISKSEFNLKKLNDVLVSNDINYKDDFIIFINDNLRTHNDWYDNLVGWLNIPGVGATSGRIINDDDVILDSGGVDSNGKYQPIFNGFPKYYQSYLGNAEWVRDLSMISGLVSATRGSLINDFIKLKCHQSNKFSIYEFYHWLVTNNQRLVMTPQCTVSISNTVSLSKYLSNIKAFSKEGMVDKYSNCNVNINNPMRLFSDESSNPLDQPILDNEITSYQSDAMILANSYDISSKELEMNRQLMKTPNKISPTSVAFVLPSFDAIYAGLMNIFSFAEYLQTKQHLNITFFILSSDRTATNYKKAVVEKIAVLKKASFVTITERDAAKIGEYSIGIATLWSTAYVLAKAKRIVRKCYFIQDNETNFYPKGSISALVDMSYRFGFFAIANTKGLLDFYSKNYSGDGVVLQSKVDLTRYFPRKNIYKIPNIPYRVFFYARPNMPRNAFELGVAGLRKLKMEMGDNVEIVTAGAAWDMGKYGVDGLFTNLGKIDYTDVPALYRNMDAGLMFMFSGHPGVTASELMASGCPVVVNEYNDITWNELYQNERTCLITEPTASEIAKNIKRCLKDINLRKKLIDGGLMKVKSYYGGYEKDLPKAYKAILKYFD